MEALTKLWHPKLQKLTCTAVPYALVTGLLPVLLRKTWAKVI
jgi:uncharacterized protein (DUF2062 family)